MKKRSGEITIGVFLLIMLVILFIKMFGEYGSSYQMVKLFSPWLLAGIGAYMSIIHLMQGKR
jgi:DMSO reductase anchor subunit